MLTKIRQFDRYSKNWDSIMAIGQKTAIAEADTTIIDLALKLRNLLIAG
jgi:hypothetical protein